MWEVERTQSDGSQTVTTIPTIYCLSATNSPFTAWSVKMDMGPLHVSFASWHTGSFVSRGHWRHTAGGTGGLSGRLGELQFFFTLWPTWYSPMLSACRVQLSPAFGHHMFSPAPDSGYNSIADSPRKNRTVPNSSHKPSQPHRHK